MPGIGDYQYQEPRGYGGSTGSRRRAMRLGALVIAIVFAVAGAYVWLSRQPAEAPAPAPVAGQAEAPSPATPKTTTGSPTDLPALDDSDALVRGRLGPLSTHAAVVAWLKTTGLARTIAVAIENTSRGLTPARHLRVLRPQGAFRVAENGTQLTIDPRSYSRYNPLAAAATSIDATAAAAAYTALKPLLQVAYDELGNEEPVDRALDRAVAGLLDAPVPGPNVIVEPGGKGIGYQYADPALEALSGAQKQLMRMGPANMRLIQAQLRTFADAAGLASAREGSGRAATVR